MSLDESLIGNFGHIKFKVRIVTIVDRYGVNIYVVIDTETTFIQKVIIYTGEYTYANI